MLFELLALGIHLFKKTLAGQFGFSATLGEPSQLNQLPADERTEFLALWAELAAVLARSGNPL